jgi:hypothetical protein
VRCDARESRVIPGKFVLSRVLFLIIHAAIMLSFALAGYFHLQWERLFFSCRSADR